MWQCVRLNPSDNVEADGENSIGEAEVRELLTGKTHKIKAKRFIICAGAILTPQILFNSGIKPYPLGRYMCEQPLAFCQVVLLQSLVDEYSKKIPMSDLPLSHPHHQVCSSSDTATVVSYYHNDFVHGSLYLGVHA